jgi:hypothetical protein
MSTGIYSRALLRHYLVVLLLGAGLAGIASAATTPRWLMEFENQCNAGSMKDCMNAASAYSLGKFHKYTVKPDKAKAEQYKQRVLQMGNQGCQNNENLANCYLLGLMYFEGRAIIRDVPKGLQIVEKACKGGHQPACNWLDDTGVY